jgi:hypothetical protein
MKIDCPYLQRFHNIFCYLSIIDTQNTFPAPDYLLEKWHSIIGDITPVIPIKSQVSNFVIYDVDTIDINEWLNYKQKWLCNFPVDDPFTEKVKSIFLLSTICSGYSCDKLRLEEFFKFGINIRSINSKKCIGVHVKITEYATELVLETSKDLITGYIRELKMEDTLKN